MATLIAVLIWSVSFVGTKIAYGTFPPLTLGALRSLLAVGILFVIVKFKKEQDKPKGRDLLCIVLSGLLGITLYFAVENTGVKLTSASNSALIVASFPAITTLFESVIYHKKPGINKITGIFLAIAGVFILTSPGMKEGGQTDIPGNILLIGAGVIWAFYNFVTGRVVNKYSSVTLLYYQMLAGTVFFLPLTLLECGSWAMPTVVSLTALLFLGIGCSVAAFLLYNYGLRKLSASTAVSLMNLVPVMGLVFSSLLLHESVTLRQVIGGAIVICGVTLSSK